MFRFPHDRAKTGLLWEESTTGELKEKVEYKRRRLGRRGFFATGTEVASLLGRRTENAPRHRPLGQQVLVRAVGVASATQNLASESTF